MLLDRRADPGDERKAVLGVADRELEHVREPPRPELLQQQQPAAEGAGDAGREHAGPGNELVAELVVALDRRRAGRDALAAERDRLAAVDREEERRHLAARPVQVRLDDLQRQPGGDGRVEGVAAALEHRHPGRGWRASGSTRPSRTCRAAPAGS